MNRRPVRSQVWPLVLCLLIAVPTVTWHCGTTTNGLVEAQPNVDKLRESNVSIHMTKMIYGSGMQPNEQGNANGVGVEILQGSGCGSGVIVGEDGTLVTNYHVARRILAASAVWDGGQMYEIGYVKALDPEHDLAILRISGQDRNFATATLGNSDDVGELDEVVAAGNGWCQGLAVTNGTINQIIRDRYGKPVQLRHSAQVLRGNSGGALYHNNDVIGINYQSYETVDVHYAIPINTVKDFLSQTNGNGLATFGERFPPDAEQILERAELVDSWTGSLTAVSAGETAAAGHTVQLEMLTDYFVLLQASNDADLQLFLHDGQRFVGYSDMNYAGPEMIFYASEMPQQAAWVVKNLTEQATNFGLKLYRIRW